MNKLFFLVWMSCSLPVVALSQEIKIVSLEELKSIYTNPNDTTYVVNFFATWCGPCLQEIPILNKFNQEHQATNVRLLYVSIDQGNDVNKLAKMVKKRKMTAPVFWLNAPGDYSWLPYIDKRWQGSIPATMVINVRKNIKAFFETPMEKGQLDFYLKKLGL